MSQNSAIRTHLDLIGHTIQYRDELTAAVRYLEAMTSIPARYMLGVGRHAAYESHYTVDALGQWASA